MFPNLMLPDVALLQLLLLTSLTGTFGSSSSSPINLRKICASISGLTGYQRSVCVEKSDAMVAFGRGSLEILAQCQRPDGVFQFEQWNCSQAINKSNAYGYWMNEASAEGAFLVSLKAAGFVLGYARACEAGNLSFCSCARLKAWSSLAADGRPANASAMLWNSQGCSAALEEATEEARKFLRSSGPPGRSRWQRVTDAHNERIGLETPRSLVTTICRCHGLSASCTQQTCFTKIPSSSEVLLKLKQKYKEARQVIPMRRLARFQFGTPPRGASGLVPLFGKAPLSEFDLIFLQPSPDYCTKQSPAGRYCAALDYGSGKRVEHCTKLCCGRGQYSRDETLLEKCQCTFEWCCRVNCKQCERSYSMSYCK